MSESPGYEKRDVSVRKIVIGTIIIAVFIAIVIFILNAVLQENEIVHYNQKLKAEYIKLTDLRAIEDEVLNNYKLLDSTNNIYQIPIKRSMELLATEAK